MNTEVADFTDLRTVAATVDSWDSREHSKGCPRAASISAMWIGVIVGIKTLSTVPQMSTSSLLHSLQKGAQWIDEL